MKVNIGPYPENSESASNRLVDVEISEYDIWNLDCTLAEIILPALKKFKDNRTGSPGIDPEDVPESLRDDSNPDTIYTERWDWVLSEMIWSFDFIVNKNNTIFFQNEEQEIRFKNGLRLFGRYYQNLWT